MRIAILVNECKEVETRQSTALLMRAAVLQGHEVWACGVGDLQVTPDGSLYAAVRSVTATSSIADMVRGLRLRRPKSIDLTSCDVVLIRTNPNRDESRAAAHDCALNIARMIRERGVLVLNDPDGLIRAANKLALIELPPHVRPATFISRSVAAVEEFIHTLGGSVVLKPVNGTRGQDVFRVLESDRSNQRQIIEVIRRHGDYVMVQEYISDETSGDTRVLVVDGRLLEVDGRAAAVCRVPKQGDFRSNIHAGGRAQPAVITDQIRSAVESMSDWLLHNGLFLVGLDFIAGRVIEINAFSPGGLRDASAYDKRDYPGAIIQMLERRVTQGASSGNDTSGGSDVLMQRGMA